MIFQKVMGETYYSVVMAVDEILGGPGNTGIGDDYLNGGDDEDRLDGGLGKNKLYGGSGLDWGSGGDCTAMKDVELSSCP